MTIRHLEKQIDELDKSVTVIEVLEKIRAEISNIPLTDTDGKNGHWYREPQAIIDDALQVIDKYETESEKSMQNSEKVSRAEVMSAQFLRTEDSTGFSETSRELHEETDHVRH